MSLPTDEEVFGTAMVEDAPQDESAELPAPIPLDDPDPPPFPDVFTGWAGDYVRAISDSTETPVALAGSAMFAVIAACIQGKASVNIEPGYFEQLSFYGACFLPSGSRKSGALNPMLRPLVEWERAQHSKLEPEIKRIESERRTLEQRIKKLRSEAAESGDPKAMEQVTELEMSLPEVPIIPRVFSQDCTVEHLGTMLDRNNGRLALFSDEGGIFDLLAGRYSANIPNLDLVLQAYTGSPVRVDRGSRPSVMLDHPALTLFVTPQPSVAEGLAATPAFRGRGLIARFALCKPASNLGHRKLIAKPVEPYIHTGYHNHVLKLLDIPVPETPTAFRLSPGAYGAWKDFQREIEAEMKPGGQLESMTDVGGKMPGLAARLAGLIHVADYGGIEQPEIPQDIMHRAIEGARFYLAHGLAVFGIMGADAAMSTARRLWREIVELGKMSVTAREVWRRVRGTYPKMADVEPGFHILIERAHLLENDEHEHRRRGRPSRQFTVNPRAAGNIGHIGFLGDRSKGGNHATP